MERLQDLDKLREHYGPEKDKKPKKKDNADLLKNMFIKQVKKEVDDEINLTYDEKLMAKF